MALDYAHMRNETYSEIRRVLLRVAPLLCGWRRLYGVPVVSVSFVLFLTARLSIFYLGLILRTLFPLLLSPFVVLYLYCDMIILGIHAIIKTSRGQ